MGDGIFYLSIIIGVFIVLKFSKNILGKLISMLLFVAVAVGIAYLIGFGPFKPNFADIYKIEENFCKGENKDQDICDCVVMPLKAEYEEKFSPDEIIELNKDKAESGYVLVKIINSIKEDAKKCLEERNREDAWKIFIKELVPVGLGVEHIGDLTDKFEDFFEDRKERKEKLDKKLEE